MVLSRRACLQLAAAGVFAGLLPATAPARAAGVQDVALRRVGDGLQLNAQLTWHLPQVVLGALLQGIPVHFIAEAQLVRERWWWRNRVLAQQQRYWRLSYQPLTRRWRLHSGSQPFDGQGLRVSLGQSYDSLQEALSAMQRLSRWRLASADAVPDSGPAQLQLRFRIDLSQLPRPLQIGALGRADWNLLVTYSQPLRLETL